MLSNNQNIGPFTFGEDATFDAIPETPGTIDLNAIKCDLRSWDGLTLIKGLTVANGGVTVGATKTTQSWATDEIDINGRPLFPAGRYQYQVWTTTPGARHPVAVGEFEVQTQDP